MRARDREARLTALVARVIAWADGQQLGRGGWDGRSGSRARFVVWAVGRTRDEGRLSVGHRLESPVW